MILSFNTKDFYQDIKALSDRIRRLKQQEAIAVRNGNMLLAAKLRYGDVIRFQHDLALEKKAVDFKIRKPKIIKQFHQELADLQAPRIQHQIKTRINPEIYFRLQNSSLNHGFNTREIFHITLKQLFNKESPPQAAGY